MLGQPRVVGRGLDREVERDLEPGLPRRGDEVVEVLQRPELGMDRVVAALLAADRPGAARIALLRLERVVAPLAVRLADRVDRRQVDDVEAELGQLRQHLLDALEAAPAAREELVPGAEARAQPLDVDLERLVERRLAVPVLRALLRGGLAPRLELARTEERLRLRELAGELGLAGRELAVELVEQGRVAVDPRLDRELPAAEPGRPEAAGPAVVAERLERLLEPLARAGRPVAHDRAEDVVAVLEDRRGHRDRIAVGRLDGIPSAVDLRAHVLDLDSGRRLLGGGCGHGSVTFSERRT